MGGKYCIVSSDTKIFIKIIIKGTKRRLISRLHIHLHCSGISHINR